MEATLQTRFTRRCVSRKRRNRALAPRMTGLTPGSVSSGLRRVQRTNVMQSIYEPVFHFFRPNNEASTMHEPRGQRESSGREPSEAMKFLIIDHGCSGFIIVGL